MSNVGINDPSVIISALELELTIDLIIENKGRFVHAVYAYFKNSTLTDTSASCRYFYKNGQVHTFHYKVTTINELRYWSVFQNVS